MKKELNEILERLTQEREKRGWTIYRLAKEANIDPQIINNWFVRNSYPAIPGLRDVCDGMDITLADFFAEYDMVELTPNRKALLDKWDLLNQSEQDTVNAVLDTIIKGKK